nr:MAG TPA: hypothetical protein [Caudoviricetes sp.]
MVEYYQVDTSLYIYLALEYDICLRFNRNT